MSCVTTRAGGCEVVTIGLVSGWRQHMQRHVANDMCDRHAHRERGRSFLGKMKLCRKYSDGFEVATRLWETEARRVGRVEAVGRLERLEQRLSSPAPMRVD